MSGECNICGQNHPEIEHCEFKDLIKELQEENKELKKALENKINPNITSMPTSKLKQLQVENKRMKKLIESYGRNPAGFDWCVLKEIDRLEQENERLKAELAKHRWIPVSEGLPETDGLYMAYAPTADPLKPLAMTAWFDPSFGWSCCPAFFTPSITYWKPIILPEQALKGGE